MKKTLLGVAAFATLALGLTACGADPTANDNGGGDAADKSSDEILIGGSLCLDGEQSAYDSLILEGVEVAIAEANDQGGILGKEVKWENLNGASDTTTIANNTEQLIERGADAIIAPADFDYGGPAARAAQDAGLVGVSPGATSPSYGSDALGDKQFTIGYWNTAMGAAAAEWAYNEQDYRNAYVVTYDGLDYTESLSRYFIESWENAGGNVVAEDKYSGGGDFSAQLQRLRGEIDNIDVIYISVYNPDLAQFIREIRAAGIDTMILGGDGYDGPELSEALGDWGGNMDTPEMRAHTTAYFKVNVPGAMFSFGDGHARQGEGETCGTAVETSMDSVIILELIKGGGPAWPRIESDEYLMTTGSVKPLEDAFRIAHLDMVNWVSELLEISHMDAYQLVSQTSLSPVANVVDTVYTMVCKVPKKVLGEAALKAFGGTHSALRQQADAWRSTQQ